eukprot:CAMPEP_0197062990 /NCGR_PEP_ID=MMETSP1384-20130603/149549_1 /TAXON_ID=29189 /ORGANISM="Ammonia sp." /LENGTH=80 /DNA_ID=CAMNT_0042499121 /DNA_START=22 /DNA_END=261 /DNA_ORIENTATION=+
MSASHHHNQRWSHSPTVVEQTALQNDDDNDDKATAHETEAEALNILSVRLSHDDDDEDDGKVDEKLQTLAPLLSDSTQSN